MYKLSVITCFLDNKLHIYTSLCIIYFYKFIQSTRSGGSIKKTKKKKIRVPEKLTLKGPREVGVMTWIINLSDLICWFKD